MFDNDQSGSGTAFVYRTTASGGLCVPQQVSYLSVTDSQERSSMNHQHMATVVTPLGLESLHSDSSNSLPSGGRSSRRLREFIPEHKKDGDYWLKRQKNNEAAKRSREKRRVNDVMMSRRIAELTNENKRLRMELDAIRRAYGSPSPRQPPPQQLASANMPYNVDVGYCMGGSQRRVSLPNPGGIAVPTSVFTSLSCSAIACPPVEPSRMMLSCDRQSFGETPLPPAAGGLGRAFDERDSSIGCLAGPVRSACALYSFSDERLRRRQMEAAVIPVGYGKEGSRTVSVANPTSCTSSSSRDCVAALSAIAHLASQAGTSAGNQVNSGMPSLVRHLNCLRTTISESYFDADVRQENVVSCRGISNSQASRRHRVEMPALLFSDVSSCDESDDGYDVLGDLYKLRSLEERPLNLSTRSGLSPIRNGEVLARSCGNARVFSEHQATVAVKSRAIMPVLESLEQMTSAFDLPTSLPRCNYSRNVLESLSKVELQSPEVPPLSSSFLLPSNDQLPEKKVLPKALTREILSTATFDDSFLEGSSCLLKLPFGASQRNLEDAPVREMRDEEEAHSVAVLSEQVISDTELYTFLRSDSAETPTKAEKDSGQVLSRPVRGGVPLKLWHKWSSAFSEELNDPMEERESDPCEANGPIHHFQD